MPTRKAGAVAPLQQKKTTAEEQEARLLAQLAANRKAQRDLDAKIRHEHRLALGTLVEACGLGTVPCDVLGEAFLWLAVALAEVGEDPATVRTQLAVLRGGKEEDGA